MTTTSVSSSSNTGTGLLSSTGVGSGLDVDTIIKAMVNAESQPLTILQKQATTMQTTLSALGSVKSYLAAFRDAASKISQPTTWNATVGTSSNSSAVSISTDANAATGAYAVTVSKLATAQTLSSQVFDPAAAVGEGTLSIERTSSGASKSISISATDTLAQVRDKINSSDMGATAHIQTDASGSRLVIQASETGSAAAFKVNVSDAASGSGLAALAYDPAASSNPMTQQQPGVNAEAKINGVDVSSASNTLTNVLDGITLTLNATTTTAAPVSVNVSRDTATIKSNITAMVTAYNSLQTYLAAQTKYDAATKTGAALQGDNTTNNIRNQLRQMMSATSGASSTFTRLSDVGFDIQKDGTIIVNDAKLTSALNNPTELRKLFANSDTAVPGNNGVGTQLRKLGDLLLGTDGVLTSRTAGLQSSISANSKRQADMQVRIDKYQARVQAQYTALDTKMSSLNALSSYVSQQVTTWNKSS